MAEEDEEIDLYNEETFGLGMILLKPQISPNKNANVEKC